MTSAARIFEAEARRERAEPTPAPVLEEAEALRAAEALSWTAVDMLPAHLREPLMRCAGKGAVEIRRTAGKTFFRLRRS